MVQQWLREYHLPGYLSIRERVRLRQLRFRALQDWGVPSIVALLPVLLQAALVLFLAGLCYLLFTLDQTVAIAFVTFVGIALTTYFAFVVLPILSRRSPYRNPLSHAVLSVVKYSTATVYVIYLVFALYGVILLSMLPKLLGTLCNISTTHWQPVNNACLRLLGYIVPTLSANLQSHPIGGHNFWIDRDVTQLSGESKSQQLDQDALVWAPSGISKSQMPSLHRCLWDLPHERRLECVLAWVAETLHLNIEAFNIGPGGAREAFGCVFSIPAICAKFDATFAARFKDCLLDVLPTRLSSETKDLHFAYVVLVLLYNLARNGTTGNADYRNAFACRLISIVAAQMPEDYNNRWSRLPSICLLDLIRTYEYRFTENGMLSSSRDASC